VNELTEFYVRTSLIIAHARAVPVAVGGRRAPVAGGPHVWHVVGPVFFLRVAVCSDL